MLNGIYRNPTIIFFGKSVDLAVGEEVKKYSKKILLHFGGESFKKYGLYGKVTNSLKSSGIEFIELGGVKLPGFFQPKSPGLIEHPLRGGGEVNRIQFYIPSVRNFFL